MLKELLYLGKINVMFRIQDRDIERYRCDI
jgi:hypothetical protein